MYGNIVEENVMYQQLQKICRGKACTKKFFGQIWENPGKIFFAPPKNCLLLHLWLTRPWSIRNALIPVNTHL